MNVDGGLAVKCNTKPSFDEHGRPYGHGERWPHEWQDGRPYELDVEAELGRPYQHGKEVGRGS